MRIKINDGDLLIVSHSREMNSKTQEDLGKFINKWLMSKGLGNVEAYLMASDVKELSFHVLSVNDVFEEQVLK